MLNVINADVTFHLYLAALAGKVVWHIATRRRLTRHSVLDVAIALAYNQLIKRQN